MIRRSAPDNEPFPPCATIFIAPNFLDLPGKFLILGSRFFILYLPGAGHPGATRTVAAICLSGQFPGNEALELHRVNQPRVKNCLFELDRARKLSDNH
jgi:hypothetical protein